MNSIIETRDLTITFGGHTAVDSVSISVPEKHFKSIIGPNGAGKTTFFNLLSGQLMPTKGKIYFSGERYHQSFSNETNKKRNWSFLSNYQCIS